MTNEQLLEIAKTSPAIKYQSTETDGFAYPANFRNRVPLKVRTVNRITPDLPQFHKILGVKTDTVCEENGEYYVWVNSLGAVSAILPNGEKLGLKPSEFEVIEWHQKDHTLLKCNECGKSYYLYQYNHLGDLKLDCPMSDKKCICGSKDIEITERK